MVYFLIYCSPYCNLPGRYHKSERLSKLGFSGVLSWAAWYVTCLYSVDRYIIYDRTVGRNMGYVDYRHMLELLLPRFPANSFFILSQKIGKLNRTKSMRSRRRQTRQDCHFIVNRSVVENRLIEMSY